MENSKVVKFNGTERSAENALMEAVKHEYKSVIIVGYKDGEVFVQPSHIDSMTTLMGAIEIAKLHLFETWEE